jgi:Holliday junction DNA helicase RuvA
MIAKIKGTLSEIDGNKGLVDTPSGVTYEVFLTPKLLSASPVSSEVAIYTYLQVRDDAHVLFGFESRAQKKLFEMLIAISGVGPKTAYGVISFSGEEELYDAVRSSDVGYFSKVPGLGKKTAMKIILELSTLLKSEFEIGKMHISEDDKTVVDALISLGFKSIDAKKILQKLPKDLSIEDKIKEALRAVTSKKQI